MINEPSLSFFSPRESKDENLDFNLAFSLELKKTKILNLFFIRLSFLNRKLNYQKKIFAFDRLTKFFYQIMQKRLAMFKLLKVLNFQKKSWCKTFMEIIQEKFSNNLAYDKLLFSANVNEIKSPILKRYSLENVNLNQKLKKILKIFSDAFFIKNVSCCQVFLNEPDFLFAKNIKKGLRRLSNKYLQLKKQQLILAWMNILFSAIKNIKIEELTGYKQFSKFALIFLPFKGSLNNP